MQAEEGSDSDLQVIDSADSAPESDSQCRSNFQIGDDDSESQVSDSCFSVPQSPMTVPNITKQESVSTPQNASTVSWLSTPGSGSISVEYGTPAEKSSIPCLPDSEKFKKDITDHIPFENLPDATGTFEKLQGVLQKVRSSKRK